MKKIVAVVLAMVMALALCTTAFAATKTETKVDKTGYSLLDVKDNSTITIDGDEFTKTVTDKEVVTSGSKTTTTYYADKYVITVNSVATPFYACDAAIAEYKLVKGSTVVFLTKTDLSKGTDKVATAYVEAKDAADQKCGDVTEDSYTIEGKNYVAGGSNFAVLNGKFVTYGAESTTVDHDFTKALKKTSGYFTTDTKGVVNTVKCETCGKSFNVVKTVDKTYTGSVKTVTFEGETTAMYVLTGTATATPAGSTGTTTSPKTFDAGIAMYVGMALTSVAGSAVVIGKKKEF
ncbi:MAG: hypothetical protein V8S83_03280 [Oscillospiraceae bacterium]